MPIMTKNQLKITRSISVRVDNATTRIQLIPNDDGTQTFRPRVNRRFLGHEFLTGEQVAKLVQEMAFGDFEVTNSPPDFRMYTRCSIVKMEDGEERQTQFQVMSKPIRGYDGQWVVFGNAVGWGRDFYPVKDVIVRAR